MLPDQDYVHPYKDFCKTIFKSFYSNHFKVTS